MDVYIARQPIFDKNMGIYGYELLYRRSNENYFVTMDDDEATAELIYNSFLVFGLNDITDGTKAFINFSKGLIDSDIPLLLPRQSTVFEILEREEATGETIEACKRIKSMGHLLALDDFVFDTGNLPLLEFADIIKIEFPALSSDVQQCLIKKYKAKAKFLAEKVETREEFEQAINLGYDFFQGYFFCKPKIVNTKDIVSLNINLFNIIKELNTPEPRYSVIAEIIQTDMGLSYKLLKLANSVYFGSMNKITSIQHALSYLGTKEIYQWISIMLLKDLQNVENAELIKLSLIRGKLMELLAADLKADCRPAEYFFTGMFSFIDVILNKEMKAVLEGLPLPSRVKDALLGVKNDQRKLLDYIIDCETVNWNEKDNINDITCCKQYMALYLDALKWAKKLNY